MVEEDSRPSRIMTREAFENAIVVNSAIGGSTNAPIHLNAIAAHLGVPLTVEDWDAVAASVPLLADVAPAAAPGGELLPRRRRAGRDGGTARGGPAARRGGDGHRPDAGHPAGGGPHRRPRGDPHGRRGRWR